MKRKIAAVLRRLARKFNLEISWREKSIDGERYIWNGVYDTAVWAPWLTPEFKSIYADIQEATVVAPDRCYVIRQLAKQALHLPGDFAECGVFKGGTARMIARLLSASGANKILHLFDSFEGMPESSEYSRDAHAPGDFGDTSMPAVQKVIDPYLAVCEFHPGFLPGTFTGLEDRAFAFVYLDLDIYPSTRDALAFFYERLVPGGILVGDDYAFSNYRYAARAAFDEFFADKPEMVLSLVSGQCVVHKLPACLN